MKRGHIGFQHIQFVVSSVTKPCAFFDPQG